MAMDQRGKALSTCTSISDRSEIKCMRSKNVVKEFGPHMLGLSECELYKRDIKNDNLLKVPGYDIMFPKSWNENGYARVVVYVKKGFKCKQVHDLEDSNIQSVWLQGGYQNSKVFCFAMHTESI